MNPRILCAVLLSMATIGALPAADARGQINVLVVTGGHGFKREPFFQMFKDNPEIRFTSAEHAKSGATVYEREDLLNFDALVLYDMPRTISEVQKKRFLSVCGKGIGLVVLHHALVSYPHWPDYERIIGGRYPEPDANKPGTVTEQVGYQHDVDVPVVVTREHPVTVGVKDFVLRDEIYWGFRVGSDVTPLLTTTHPKSGKPLGWTRSEGKSFVVYLQGGHGPEAFENPNYRLLLRQSIRWVASRARGVNAGSSSP